VRPNYSASSPEYPEYNFGFKYLLTCTDIFFKYAWVLPLKTKQGQELVKTFQTILSSGRKPRKLQTDQGTEFLNRVFQKFLHDNNIDFLTSNSGLKASVVERFDRTFKNKLYKHIYLTYTSCCLLFSFRV